MAGLAKLKLVMEIDGDKVVVTGMERVDAAIDRTGRTTQTATEHMASGMGNVETATGRMAAGMGKTETATGMMTAAAAGLYTMLQRVIGAWASWEILQKGKDATMFAANMEMAERALGVVGNQTGQTVEKMAKYRDGLKDINITSMASTGTIAMMARANLDLDGAIPLARLAQGAARMKSLKGETVSSSAALDAMISGIITMQPEMLKQFGITTTVEGAMRRYKQATGESAEALTEQQRVQLFFNDVLRDGQPLMSLYVNTLDLASSKISSSQRPVEELKLALGQLFLPELNIAATAYYNTVSGGMKWVKQHADELKGLSQSIEWLSGALITGGTVYLGYLALYKGTVLITAISAQVQAFHAGQVANAEYSSQLAAGNVVQLNSVQATAMKTAAQAESARVAASASLAELDHATALQTGLVAEREITVAKLQNVIANESLIKSQVMAAEIELSQAALRTEAINANLAMIAKENAALAEKGTLTKSEVAFSNELRNAEFVSRNKLVIATQEQAAAEERLAQIQTSSLEATQLKTGALNELAIVNKSAAIATTQLTEATLLNEKAQFQSVAATEAAAAAASKAKWAWLSLGNAVNVLFAAYAGWEIGSWLNKFESVRVAGAAMVGGIIETWNRFLFVLDRVKASANPFGNGDEQIAALNRINEAEKQWKINHDQIMAGVFDDTNTAPSATKPYQNDQAAMAAANKAKADAAAAAAKAAAEKASQERQALAEKQAQYDKSVADAKIALAHTISGNERKLEEANMQERLKQIQFEHDTGLLSAQDLINKKYELEKTSREKNLASVLEYQKEAQTALDKINNGGNATDLKMQLDAKNKLAEATGAVELAQKKLNALPNEKVRENIKLAIAQYLALEKVRTELHSLTAANDALAASMVGANAQGDFNTLADQQLNAYAKLNQAHQNEIRLINEQLEASDYAYGSTITTEASLLKWKEEQYTLTEKLSILEKKNAQDRAKIAYDTTAIGGMTNAIQQYGKDADNVGKQMENTFTGAFRNIEESIITAFKKGEFSAKAMIDYVQTEFLRMAVAKPITNYVAGQIGNIGSLLGVGQSSTYIPNNVSGTSSVSSAGAGAAGEMAGIGIGAALGIETLSRVFEGLKDTSAQAAKAMEDMRKQIAFMITDFESRSLRASGQTSEADILDLKNKQARETEDLRQQFYQLSHGDSIADIDRARKERDIDRAGGWNNQSLSQARDNSAWVQNMNSMLDAMDKLDVAQKKELNNLIAKKDLAINNLRLQELDLMGEKNSVNYKAILEEVRKADLVGLNEATIAIQRHIYALQDQKEAQDLVTTALGKTVDIAISAANAMKDIQGGSLSTDSPLEKLRKAKEAWDSSSPDKAGELGKSYLTALQGVYASGQGYQTGYLEVMSKLQTISGTPVGTTAEKQLSVLEQIKNALTDGTQPYLKNLKTGSTINNIITAANATDVVTQITKQLPGRPVPSYDIGSAYIPFDQYANVHQGEIIMDRASSDVLRKYGIRTSGSADNKGVEERLDKAVRALESLEAKLATIETVARVERNKPKRAA